MRTSTQIAAGMICCLQFAGTTACRSAARRSQIETVVQVNNAEAQGVQFPIPHRLAPERVVQAASQDKLRPLAAADGHRTFFASERVLVVPPDRPLLLATHYELQLKLQRPDLKTVGVFQTLEVEPSMPLQDVFGGDQDLPVLKRQNGETYVDVVPLRLGKLVLKISGRFSDGGVFDTRLNVIVEPPATIPKKLIVGSGTSPDSAPLRLALSLEPQIGAFVVPNAMYEGVDQLLPIDRHFVQFAIRTKADRPVVSLNPISGFLTPLAVGHALIETSYSGIKSLTCVIVFGNASEGEHDRSRCAELLKPGESLVLPQ